MSGSLTRGNHMKQNSEVVSAFEAPLHILHQQNSKDTLLNHLMAARASCKYHDTRLLNRIDLLCWKRISELQKGCI